MDLFYQLLNNIHAFIVIAGGILSLIAWRYADFTAPKYIHVIAFISGVIGLFLALLSQYAGSSNQKAVWLVIGFPAATYFIFGFFGGGHIMLNKGSNNEQKP